MNRISARSIRSMTITLALLLCSFGVTAQQPTAEHDPLAPHGDDSGLNHHLDELTTKLDSMRQQLIESQNEMDELRNELRSLRQQLADRDRRIRPRATPPR